MRRTLPLLVTATLLFAACSGSDDNASDSSSGEVASTDETSATSDTSDTAEADTDTSGTEVGDTVAPPPTNPDKPEVEVPDEIPTELQVTVIEEGTGPEAAAGDTVIVDYVGVRTRDGVEFDNSFDRFQQLPVVLGQGRVIPGWDQGLLGAQTGSRLRLDIPSELAYGAEGSGAIIGPDEALTFLIDVLAVVSPSNPDDAPSEPGVEATSSVEQVVTSDLVEGTGETAEDGQTVLFDYVIFRADNGALLASTWGTDPSPFPLTDGAFPVLVEGIPGMNVGGRRAITFPPTYPEFGFGPEGAPTEGLPADTPVTIVVDLRAVYGQPES
jgi:peptidylprolyl isomerase